MSAPVSPILPVASPRRTRAWLFGELRRRPTRLIAAATLGVIASAASIVPITLLGAVVDRVREGRTAGLTELAIAIGVAAVLGGLGTGLASYLTAGLGETMLADLRERVMARALALPATTVEESGRGDLLSRVGPDVAVVARAVGEVLPQFLGASALGVVTLIGMAGLDWRLGLAGALAVPAYLAGLRWYLPRSAPMYAQERVAIAERAQVTVESLQSVRTIDAYEIHDHHLAGIDAASGRARDVSVAVFAFFTRFVGRVNRAEFVGLAATLVVGFLLVRDGAVTVGQVTAAALMFHRLFNPIGELMFDFDEIQSATASLARLVGVADMAPDAAGAGSGRPPSSADVTLTGVRFRYGTAGGEVLHDVSLHVPAGTRCALVGTTGAGKTTLGALVAGLHPPTAGSVLIGGVDATDVDTTAIDAADAADAEPGGGAPRRWVASVTQEVHVFAGTLLDDLRLAAPGATHEQVWAALDRVGADWVHSLPDGLDTQVGENGTTLSAARAQHVALARVVLVDPRVVVLDEATAEAGSANAADLERAAVAATSGRTTLVVAHRLTQASSADQIVVLDDGRIVERGTHAELLDRDDRYARLWRAWRAHG